MANTRELRRRIKSIKNTSQITKAMQMVAATKMRRAQIQAESGNPYTQTLNETLKRLTQGVDQTLNPLLLENDSKNIGVILLSTDKGLVGALNTNLMRTIMNFSRHPGLDPGSIKNNSMDSRFRGNDSIVFYTLGRKGRQFLVRTGKELAADFENPETVTFKQARQLGKIVKDAFLASELKEVYLIYSDFVSTLRQEPRVVKLLPISLESLEVEVGLSSSSMLNPQPMSSSSLTGGSRNTTKMDSRFRGNDSEESTDFLFEPDTAMLLDYVLSHSIEAKIYHALLETKASEHSARMVAMKNATDNAKELVEDLTLSYNQTRQEAITSELLEITTAQAALE